MLIFGQKTFFMPDNKFNFLRYSEWKIMASSTNKSKEKNCVDQEILI